MFEKGASPYSVVTLNVCLGVDPPPSTGYGDFAAGAGCAGSALKARSVIWYPEFDWVPCPPSVYSPFLLSMCVWLDVGSGYAVHFIRHRG